MNAVVREDVFIPCLKSLPLFDGQDNGLLRFLTVHSELIQVGKGELVCQKGREVSGLFCVLDGSIKVAVISHQGNERVLEIVGRGGTFGEASMVLQRPCPVYIEALTRSQLVFFRRSMVLEALRSHPGFALALLSGLSDRMLRLVRDVEICCLQPAGDRVVSFLLDQARPLADGRNRADVQLPAGKAVVASSLNLTPETFSRELHRLVDQGLIAVERRLVHVLDLGRLESLLLGCEV